VSLLTAIFAVLLMVSAALPARASGIPTDRWIEIDLYWFDPEKAEVSADIFWDRYAPLYRDVEGYKGIVLNVGMTANYVFAFSGDLNQEIHLPQTGGQELGHRVRGQLEGDTAARQKAWRDRYEKPADTASVPYGRWTYRDLRRLTDALRSRAAEEGIRDFRVGSLAVGQDGTYGAPMPFSQLHPEAFTRWGEQAPGALASSSHLDPSNLLRADPAPLGGLPNGIPEEMPVHALFAAQWGALSKAVGLDGIILRDSFSFPRAYTRYGPFGPRVPDTASAERMTSGLASLIRGAKQANPNTLIMMYSTAATATSDWRANGIDLERIAREGYLDIFVDQTWAGAWGEVGVRQQTFWNAPILGWTYQLAYMLQHAAVLADTRVRHYPLVETFDAWESWDTIHTAPERLRWAIWAYSHAGVKTPTGLRMPAGSYISWGNHGRDLLSAADVAFLASEMNAAARDAATTADIAGPTIVYSRDTAVAQMANLKSGLNVQDRTDEQIGSIIKWPLPILSVTRAEWSTKVKSDLFVFGATAGMPREQVRSVKQLAGRGQAMAFFGGLDGATHPEFAELFQASAAPHRPRIQDRVLRATAGAAWPGNFSSTTREFDAPPPTSSMNAPPSTIVYGFGSSAGLVVKSSGSRNLALWDPVPIFDYWYRPLRDLMNGDPTPFALTAATLNAQLARAGAFSAATIDPAQTGTVAAWYGRDGSIRLLAGNLEEGLRDDADRSRRLSLRTPRQWQLCDWQSNWAGSKLSTNDDLLGLWLAPQGSAMLHCRRSVRQK
jgi:hypothetical protein